MRGVVAALDVLAAVRGLACLAAETVVGEARDAQAFVGDGFHAPRAAVAHAPNAARFVGFAGAVTVGVVAVSGDQRLHRPARHDAARCSHLVHAAHAVVPGARAAARSVDLAHAVVAPVVAVAHELAEGVFHLHQAVALVVAVAGDRAGRAGRGLNARHLAVERVVDIAGALAQGVDFARHAPGLVVLAPLLVAQRVDHRHAVCQAVVAVAGELAKRVGFGHEVAGQVVAVHTQHRTCGGVELRGQHAGVVPAHARDLAAQAGRAVDLNFRTKAHDLLVAAVVDAVGDDGRHALVARVESDLGGLGAEEARHQLVARGVHAVAPPQPVFFVAADDMAGGVVFDLGEVGLLRQAIGRALPALAAWRAGRAQGKAGGVGRQGPGVGTGRDADVVPVLADRTTGFARQHLHRVAAHREAAHRHRVGWWHHRCTLRRREVGGQGSSAHRDAAPLDDDFAARVVGVEDLEVVNAGLKVDAAAEAVAVAREGGRAGEVHTGVCAAVGDLQAACQVGRFVGVQRHTNVGAVVVEVGVDACGCFGRAPGAQVVKLEVGRAELRAVRRDDFVAIEDVERATAVARRKFRREVDGAVEGVLRHLGLVQAHAVDQDHLAGVGLQRSQRARQRPVRRARGVVEQVRPGAGEGCSHRFQRGTTVGPTQRVKARLGLRNAHRPGVA